MDEIMDKLICENESHWRGTRPFKYYDCDNQSVFQVHLSIREDRHQCCNLVVITTHQCQMKCIRLSAELKLEYAIMHVSSSTHNLHVLNVLHTLLLHRRLQNPACFYPITVFFNCIGIKIKIYFGIILRI